MSTTSHLEMQFDDEDVLTLAQCEISKEYQGVIFDKLVGWTDGKKGEDGLEAFNTRRQRAEQLMYEDKVKMGVYPEGYKTHTSAGKLLRAAVWYPGTGATFRQYESNIKTALRNGIDLHDSEGKVVGRNELLRVVSKSKSLPPREDLIHSMKNLVRKAEVYETQGHTDVSDVKNRLVELIIELSHA